MKTLKINKKVTTGIVIGAAVAALSVWGILSISGSAAEADVNSELLSAGTTGGGGTVVTAAKTAIGSVNQQNKEYEAYLEDRYDSSEFAAIEAGSEAGAYDAYNEYNGAQDEYAGSEENGQDADQVDTKTKKHKKNAKSASENNEKGDACEEEYADPTAGMTDEELAEEKRIEAISDQMAGVYSAHRGLWDKVEAAETPDVLAQDDYDEIDFILGMDNLTDAEKEMLLDDIKKLDDLDKQLM